MGDDLINEAVFFGLLRRKEVVALGIQLHLFQRLAGVLAEQPVHLGAGADEMVGMDLDVGSLSGQTAALTAGDEGLVDHDLGVGQGKALALGAAGQQERTHRGGHAHADGGDVTLDILDGIVDLTKFIYPIR